MKINYILKYIYFTIILKPITIILYYLVGSFFSSYVIIDKKLYLSSGNRRNVYIHPNDNNKIIKINKEGYIWNNNMENYRSYLFMSKLNYISKNYGLTSTNLGIGIVYELIRDYDNNISKTVHYYLQNNIYNDEIINQLKKYYKEFYENYDIIIHNNKSNILVKKISNEKIKLVIIDGYDTFLDSKLNLA